MTDQLELTGPHGEQLISMREWLDAYRAENRVHVLVVTREDGELEYAIECPGVTTGCRVWWECMDCQSRIAKGDDDLADQLSETSEAHGVAHQILEHGWSTPGVECWGQEYPELTEAAEELLGENPEPGRYNVRLIADDQSLVLQLVTEESERKLDEALARRAARQS